MNKTHRIVWSEARQTYVVAHENAAAHGKSSSTRKGVAQAVAVALLALGAGAAVADSCVGATVISANTSDPCLLTIGESVTINNGRSLAVSGASERAVTAEGATGSGDIAAGDILNNGTIASVVSGQSAIRLLPGVSGVLAATSIPRVSVSSITNNGLINAGSEGGIVMEYAADSDGYKIGTTITGDIINTGTITTTGTDSIRGIGATIGGRIVNNSLIQGQIKFFTSVITSGITNTGTVSGPNTAGLNMWPVQVGDVKNTGLIQGTRGVQFGGATTTMARTTIASITNDGTINATSGNGLALFSGASVAHGLTNSGTISGGPNGISISLSTVSGGIVNGGLIEAAAGHAIALIQATISGAIVNSGTIKSLGTEHAGLNIGFANILTSVTNSGTIQGANMGVQISTNSVLASLTNSGTISGATAIDRSGGGVSAPALVIDGNNAAKFIGAVDFPDSPVTLASGAVYTMQGGEIFTLNGTSSGFAVASNATLGVAAGGTGTITGVYTQDASATFRTHANSTTFGKLLISGSTTLPASAKFEVMTVDAATCDGITASITLAGVISATSLTAPSFATVTDHCDGINFTAVKNGNAVDLVASAAPPTTWPMTGATNNAGFGTVSCVSPVANNGTATCTGTASGGYYLASAVGNSSVCGTVSVSGSTITAGPVTAACTVTGTFAASSTYAVTATANPVAGGSVTCTPASGIASGGSSTCSGTANPGYTFTNWGGDCASAGSSATCTLTNITAAKSVTANFTAASTSQATIPTTANGVTASMSVSGCTSISSAAFAAPTSGAPSNTTFPFGMLGFTLTGCISGPVTVTVTYSQNLPSNATFYKNINGSYAPYSATLGINTVQFVLQDGIAGDADLSVNGSIRDPGGIGVPSTTESIPTLSEWGVIALTGLMGLFGLRQVRRRKIHS